MPASLILMNPSPSRRAPRQTVRLGAAIKAAAKAATRKNPSKQSAQLARIMSSAGFSQADIDAAVAANGRHQRRRPTAAERAQTAQRLAARRAFESSPGGKRQILAARKRVRHTQPAYAAGVAARINKIISESRGRELTPRQAEAEARKIQRLLERVPTRSNPFKESKMARRSAKSVVRSNPSRKRRIRRNPEGEAAAAAAAPAKAKAKRRTKAEVMQERSAALLAGGTLPGVTPEQLAAIITALTAKPAKGGGRRVGAVGAVRAEMKAERTAFKESVKGLGKKARAMALAQFRQKLRASDRVYAKDELIKLISSNVLGGTKGDIKAARAMDALRTKAMGFTKVANGLQYIGPRHAMAWAVRTPKKAGGNDAKAMLAKAYLQAKVASRTGDAQAQAFAKALGLSTLPNGWSMGMMVKEVKMDLPVIAGAMGGTALMYAGVSWAQSKLRTMTWVPESVKPYLTPVLALSAGIAVSSVMKRSKSTAKFSGAALVGGAAVATFALLAHKGADGKSWGEKIAPAGLAGLGEYHMGDYHMGMTVGSAASLNFGEYHMGAIDVVTDRRMLAPPGGSMPRHDTLRDGVDQSIESFSGTLAGDIFDQG